MTSVHKEPESSAADLQTLLSELPTGAIPYPGLDLTSWPLVSRALIFTTLRSETIDSLTHAYNRMATANEQLAFLSDLNHGPTAILATATAAGRLTDKEASDAYNMFVDYRDKIRSSLIERLKELKPHIDAAIDDVEKDLKRSVEQRAAARRYVSARRVGVIE